MDYEAVIGLETHVQFKAKSQMWCACANEFGVSNYRSWHRQRIRCWQCPSRARSPIESESFRFRSTCVDL